MAGLSGWLGVPVDDPNSVGDAMASALARHDGSLKNAQRGDQWSVQAARARQAPAIVTAGPVVGALFGDVRGSFSGDIHAALVQICDAYAVQELGFLDRLEGVFALALFHPEAQRVLLVSDRVGVVPIYYWAAGGGLAFSTRLPALYELPGVGHDIDHQAIYSYLYFHAIPSPQSIYRDIRRMRPGSVLELCDGRITERVYWQPWYRDERSRSGVSELKPEFRAAIEQSVRDEIDLGGEVGCFLSGGTDSSTVAGHLDKLERTRARSFSIGFDEPGYDETGFAQIAAKHFGTLHREYYVQPNDIVDLVPRLGEYYGCPFGNSSVIPTYYCARLAREHGIDRMLGGDGGDELFGGNQRYAKQKVFGLYDKVPGWFRNLLLEPVVSAFPTWREDHAGAQGATVHRAGQGADARPHGNLQPHELV